MNTLCQKLRPLLFKAVVLTFDKVYSNNCQVSKSNKNKADKLFDIQKSYASVISANYFTINYAKLLRGV